MVIFYIIGLLIRRTILDTFDTHKQKEQERQEEEQRLLLEKKRAEERAESEKAEKERNSSSHTSTSTLDLAADEEIEIGTADGFSDLPINEYLDTELERNS
jgi:sortase (surface protein transpeptidase)